MSQELAFLASDADLVILEGMVSSLRIGTGILRFFRQNPPNDNYEVSEMR